RLPSRRRSPKRPPPSRTSAAVGFIYPVKLAARMTARAAFACFTTLTTCFAAFTPDALFFWIVFDAPLTPLAAWMFAVTELVAVAGCWPAFVAVTSAVLMYAAPSAAVIVCEHVNVMDR